MHKCVSDYPYLTYPNLSWILLQNRLQSNLLSSVHQKQTQLSDKTRQLRICVLPLRPWTNLRSNIILGPLNFWVLNSPFWNWNIKKWTLLVFKILYLLLKFKWAKYQPENSNNSISTCRRRPFLVKAWASRLSLHFDTVKNVTLLGSDWLSYVTGWISLPKKVTRTTTKKQEESTEGN